MVSGIHSPATRRSAQPSLLISPNVADVTTPILAREMEFSFAREKRAFPSFIYKKDVCGIPYAFGLERLPTKRSVSPSLSISATATQDLF